jgi:glutathione synthase/RimK-type ligase-like ATP-grasp enzyme
MVIEINDNPNLEHGVEDEADRNVWAHLTEWFVRRLSA